SASHCRKTQPVTSYSPVSVSRGSRATTPRSTSRTAAEAGAEPCRGRPVAGLFRFRRGRTVDKKSPILDVQGLRKSFGGLEVLKGIDLAVHPQELVFIIGPSGSGKSTLLRCCNRLEEATSGSIWVDGVDVLSRSTDINRLRQRIGMVFQSFNLYPHMTALGNVTLALRKVLKLKRDEADRRGRAALDDVGLRDK